MLMRSYRYGLFAFMLLLVLGVPMAAAQSPELPLGSELPMANHSMESADGGQISLSSVGGQNGTVVIFWSNQCPWVDKYEDRVMEIAESFPGFGYVLVNANDPVAYPQESMEESQRLAGRYSMPYVLDADSELARAFGAERTPHIYVFDESDTLVYVGTIDDSPGDPNNVQETYLEDALQAVSQGNEVGVAQTKAFGCTIKLQG